MPHPVILPFSMLTPILIGIGALALMILLTAANAAIKKRIVQKTLPPAGKTKARNLLTLREQPMYFRLKDAFPDDVILAQVAFSALVTANERSIRNTFDRKYADFVICTKSFIVKAVVELDDATHDGREMEDAQRAAILEQAGYKVLRYREVPDIEQLRKDIEEKNKAEAPKGYTRKEPTFNIDRHGNSD